MCHPVHFRARCHENYLQILGEGLDGLDARVGPATDLLLNQAELLLAEVGSVQVDIAQDGHLRRRWLRRERLFTGG